MSALPMREEAIRLIETLDEADLRQVVELLKRLHTESARDDEYDEAADPMLNGEAAFEGAEDLAERSEEVLHQEWYHHLKREDNVK